MKAPGSTHSLYPTAVAPRRQPETIENSADRLGRVNGRNDAHSAATTTTLDNVNREERVASALPTNSCAAAGCDVASWNTPPGECPAIFL